MTTTVACTNINLLTGAQMPASPSNTELYAVELSGQPMDTNASNATSTAKETIVGWGMPDYSAEVSISSGYTAPKNGLFLYNGNNYSGAAVFYVNGTSIYTSTGYSTDRMQHNVFLQLNTGDVITWSISNATTDSGVFIPFKGGV